MQYQRIDEVADYELLRFQLLVNVEQSGVPALTPYSDGRAVTIGVGFNLQDAGIRALVLNFFGVTQAELTFVPLNALLSLDWTEAQMPQLIPQLNALIAQEGNRANFAFNDPNEVRAFFDSSVIGLYETGLDAAISDVNELGTILQTVPDSRERLALLSLHYNEDPGNRPLLGERLTAAIVAGERAAAWYEIRYRSNGGAEAQQEGVAKRRYYESQMFGLYDDEDTVFATRRLRRSTSTGSWLHSMQH